VLYRIHEDSREVIVLRIEHRSDVYRPRYTSTGRLTGQTSFGDRTCITTTPAHVKSCADLEDRTCAEAATGGSRSCRYAVGGVVPYAEGYLHTFHKE
jgi:hypothetical protein